MLPEQLYHLACLIAHLRNCDSSYIAQRYACGHALNTNDQASDLVNLFRANTLATSAECCGEFDKSDYVNFPD